MRGQLTFDMQTPVQGLLKDRPSHLVGPDGLLAGTNMLLDADGYYRPRSGYLAWLDNQPTEALLGMNFYRDTDATYQYVGAGLTNVWAVRAGAWAGQGGNLHSDIEDLISVEPFLQPFLDGATTTDLSALICNNNDPIVLWNQSLSVAQPLTPVHDASSGNALFFVTTPSFGVYPVSLPGPNWFFTVSGPNSGFATLNINAIGAKPLRYIGPLGTVDELPANYLIPGVTYNVGYDGTQFLIGSNLTAPIARAIEIVNSRVVAVNVVSGSIRVAAQVTWSSPFDGSVWPADAFRNMVDTNDPLITIRKIGLSAAVVYGEQSGYLMSGVPGAGDADAFSFTPINGLIAGPVSALAVIPWEQGHLFLARDGRIWNTDGINARPFNGALTSVLQAAIDAAKQQRSFSLQDVVNRRIWFFFPPVGSNGSDAVVMTLDPQPHFEVLQTFSTRFTSAMSPALQTGVLISNLVNPIATYTQPINSFQTAQAMTNLISDAAGVHLFGPFAGALDGGRASVPYSFTPGLMSEGPDKDIRPESFDLFLQPTTFSELGTVQFDELQYPDDPGKTILAAAFSMGDPASFTMPQVNPEMSAYSRYLRMTISGNSATRAFAYGGARVYANQQGRPSR